MAQFHYLEFSESSVLGGDAREEHRHSHSFSFYSTDSKTINWLIASIKKSSYDLANDTLSSGENYFVSFSVNKKAIDPVEGARLVQKLRWWLLAKLGQMGWEAFALSSGGEPESVQSGLLVFVTHDLGTIHFRKQEEIAKSTGE
jgi:hypothetical protein